MKDKIQMMQQSASDAVKTAANNFILLSVKVSFWDGVAKLTGAAEKAALNAGADPDGTRMYKNLLGQFHGKLREVKTKFRKLRTALDTASIPYALAQDDGQRRGEKMLHVTRYPKVIAELTSLRDSAFDQLSEFLSNYDEYRSQALDQNFGTWRAEAERLFPTKTEVMAKFCIEISDPKPLPVFSDAQQATFNVPANVMAEIVAQSNTAIAKQLEGAKQDQIKSALKTCETALKQLTDGKRFHQSVIDNVKKEAVKLGEISQGYDGDHRVKKIAETMLDGIANVTDPDQWKNHDGKKAEAKLAAEKSVQNLKRMAQAAPVAPIPDTSGVILPEITADLI